MNNLIWIMGATIIVSLLGFVGVFSLWIKQKNINRIAGFLVAFSAGALLGGAFFHLLPESIENIKGLPVFGFALIGFVVFLLIESFFHSHFCKECHAHPFTYMMLIGDGVHNLIDGLVIAAAFFTNFTLGIVTSLMIVGHELPQEIGLFGALIHGGHEQRKAMLYSFLAQSTVIVGGIIGFLAAAKTDFIVPFLLPFAAGGFIYIASADLVPEMHKIYDGDLKKSAKILAAFTIGILFMLALKLYFGH